ncbi:MAG: carboxypeptidase-like regulatory domain-containing protein [Bryobacter sp.]|nr:carboxypeptidase-like regulatory domain-containing protein [Bryobacter sp.]
MKVGFVLLFASLAWSQISGRVVNSVTGEGVGKALVRLTGRGIARSVMTAKDGSFVFAKVAEGNYTLEPLKQNYFAKGSAMRVEVREEDKVEGLVFGLEPGAVIAGRLLDEDGDPLEGVSVTGARRVYREGTYVMESVWQGRTNDLGEFRLSGLKAGRYFIKAQAPSSMFSMLNEPYEASDGEYARVPSYFPGVADLESARPIVVKPGQVVTGMDFSALRGKVYRVEGKFALAESDGQLYATLDRIGMLKDTSGFPQPQTAIFPGSGAFQFRGIQPGRYLLTVSSNTKAGLQGQVEVTVGGADVKDLDVPRIETGPLRGVIRLEGAEDNAEQWKSGLELVLYCQIGLRSTTGTSVTPAPDGSFEFERGISGRKTLQVQKMPKPLFLKHFRLNGKELEDAVFYEGGEIEMILSPRVSGILGKVEGAKGGTVIAQSIKAKRLGSGEGLNLDAEIAPLGAFEFGAIGPGEYRLYAFDRNFEENLLDPEFLRNFAAKSVIVKIGEGETKTVTLPLIAASEVEEAQNQ